MGAFPLLAMSGVGSKELISLDASFSDTDSFTSDFEDLGEDMNASSTLEDSPTANKIRPGSLSMYGQLLSPDGSEETEDSSKELEDDQIFKKSLIEFESCISWTAVTEDFKEYREQWIENVQQADTPDKAAKHLLELSTFIKPECFYEPEFISTQWALQVSQPAVTYSILCGLLLALEETMNEETSPFISAWTSKVDSWREILEEAEYGYGSDTDDL